MTPEQILEIAAMVTDDPNILEMRHGRYGHPGQGEIELNEVPIGDYLAAVSYVYDVETYGGYDAGDHMTPPSYPQPQIGDVTVKEMTVYDNNGDEVQPSSPEEQAAWVALAIEYFQKRSDGLLEREAERMDWY